MVDSLGGSCGDDGRDRGSPCRDRSALGLLRPRRLLLDPHRSRRNADPAHGGRACARGRRRRWRPTSASHRDGRVLAPRTVHAGRVAGPALLPNRTAWTSGGRVAAPNRDPGDDARGAIPGVPCVGCQGVHMCRPVRPDRLKEGPLCARVLCFVRFESTRRSAGSIISLVRRHAVRFRVGWAS